MVMDMDRRQRKTREAIFAAFTQLLSQKNFNRITVGEIIDAADVGRATFYAHFSTKDHLLESFCGELFCHIFDVEGQEGADHRHIFACEGADSAFLHLFQHLQRNDNNILRLLSSRNNELFWQYFRKGLMQMVERHGELFAARRQASVSDDFWKNHIAATLGETLKWWIDNGLQQSPQEITAWFFAVV